MIKIVSDSSCDLPRIPGLDIGFVPMTMSTDEKSFTDNPRLDVADMVAYMSAYKGRSYTACPSLDAWLTAFEGGDEIYVVTITSGLSGSYNSAMAARDLYQTEHPGARVAVFDSLSTGPEMRLILEKIGELTGQGLPFDQVEAQVREYQNHTRLFFSLQSVHNLSQNGRVSKVVAAAVGVLGIRIVGTASPEGTLSPQAKCRGDKKALPELISQMQNAGCTGTKIRITNVQNPTLAEKFAELVRQTWPNADITVAPSSGLCSYYAEMGAIMVGFETK